MTGKRVFDFGSVTFGKEATRTRLVDRPPARPAGSVAPPEARGPMPIVVGCPRSGTTLLAVMLDSHPKVAVPPETAFLPELCKLASREPAALRERFIDLVTTDRWGVSNWNDLGLDREHFRQRLVELSDFSITAGLRVLFGMVADRAGKPLYGEKTPADASFMPGIAALLPEARFVHIVRDPRDVVLSLGRTSVGLGVEQAARQWATIVATARAARGQVAHLHEVRYEDLLAEPEAQLRAICAFLDLEYSARMLDHRASGARHVAQLGDRRLPDGRATVPHALRAKLHENLTQPIRADRAGGWRDAMSDGDRAKVEAIAGPLMRELGYD